MEVSILVAVIVGLVEALKRTGLNSKWAPLVSIAFGIAFSAAFSWTDGAASFIVEGIMIGLMSAGLYSGGKAVVFNK